MTQTRRQQALPEWQGRDERRSSLTLTIITDQDLEEFPKLLNVIREHGNYEYDQLRCAWVYVVPLIYIEGLGDD